MAELDHLDLDLVLDEETLQNLADEIQTNATSQEQTDEEEITDLVLPKPSRLAEGICPEEMTEDRVETLKIKGQELDVGQLPQYKIIGFEDAAKIAVMFLQAVREQYEETGVGLFDVVLVWNTGCVHESTMASLRRNFAVYISRLRKARPSVTPFKAFFTEEVADDTNTYVIVRLARMTQPNYKAYVKQRARVSAATARRASAEALL